MTYSDVLRAAEPTPERNLITGERKKGYLAAMDEQSRSDCPHKKLGRNRTEWLAGFWQFTRGKPLLDRGGRYEPWGDKADPQTSRRRHNARLAESCKARLAA